MATIKLSKTKVKNIRTLYKEGGWTHLKLSLRFKCYRGHITKVINYKRWSLEHYPKL